MPVAIPTKAENARIAVQRSRWPWIKLLLLLVAVFVALLLYLRVGATSMSFTEVMKALFNRADNPGDTDAIWVIRMPRALGCLVVGGLLGMVGSAFQALFRNPLAEPYVVGVSSGAAVGGALALVTGFGTAWEGFASGLGPRLAAFPCGLISLLLVFVISRRRGIIEAQTLLLAGVVTSAMLSAVLSLVLLAGGQDTNKVLRWLLGSMSPMYMNRVAIMAIVMVVGGLILIGQSRSLNVFALGEDTAERLGVNTQRLKPLVLITGTAMVAVTVGAVGIIGFLGLVAPHIARRLLGVDWRWSLIGSCILGSALLLVADLLAQRVVPDAEIPVGIVTALIGAPFLLVILKRSG